MHQINWIGQLVESEVRFALHIDGKHKLHHGKWMLVTIGTHDIRCNSEQRTKVTHSYRPLVYMLCKQQETQESVQLLCDALDWVALEYFGRLLQPGVALMDHSNGFRNGILRTWNDIGAYRARISTISLVSMISDLRTYSDIS